MVVACVCSKILYFGYFGGERFDARGTYSSLYILLQLPRQQPVAYMLTSNRHVLVPIIIRDIGIQCHCIE